MTRKVINLAADVMAEKGYKEGLDRQVDLLVWQATEHRLRTQLVQKNLRFEESKPYSWDGPLVQGRGFAMSDLAIVAYQPSETDLETGFALTGEAGILLEMVLKKAGIHPGTVYRTTFLKGLPSKGYKLKPEDIEMSVIQMAAEMSVVEPRAILLMGQQTAQQMLARPDFDLHSDRGIWTDFLGGAPVMPTVALDYILQAKDVDRAKKMFWDDLHQAAERAKVIEAKKEAAAS